MQVTYKAPVSHQYAFSKLIGAIMHPATSQNWFCLWPCWQVLQGKCPLLPLHPNRILRSSASSFPAHSAPSPPMPLPLLMPLSCSCPWSCPQAAPAAALADALVLHSPVHKQGRPCGFCMQVWEAVGGKEVFKTNACHEMLRDYSSEVRGATLANFVGDRVFNSIFAEGSLFVYCCIMYT